MMKYRSELTKTQYPYDISVAVLTYHSDLGKTLETLRTIIAQKGVRIQIIVSDDGSDENHFPEIRSFLEREGVNDPILLAGERNQGTVSNTVRAVSAAQAEYTKLISPGDGLLGEECFVHWLQAVRTEQAVWSFSEAVYYRLENGRKRAVLATAHPILTAPYRFGWKDRARWNYAVLGDVANAVSILCKTDVLLRYLKLLEGKVIYAEDYSYKLMMFDGVIGMYYPTPTILYEVGTGISTSKDNVWADRLDRDLRAAQSLMISRRDPKDKLQRKMADALLRISDRKGWRGPFCRGEIRFILIKKFFPRRTKCVDLAG